VAIPFIPTTAGELERAVVDGVLVEGTNFDAKGVLDNGPTANKKLAIDLAAFSVLGGLIAVGVAERDEGSGKRLVCEPVALDGLKERVSQVGTSRCDPPVAVTTRELPVGDGKGYLLVLIPASPAAPHQVDGQYRARADTTNYVLTDADVRRIQAERRRASRDIDVELQDMVRRDPTPADLRKQAHLFIVARPQLPTSPTMLHDALGQTWQDWTRSDLLQKPTLGIFAPDFTRSFSRIERRPDGWASISHEFLGGRVLRPDADETHLIEFEVDEDGRLRLFCGRGSDTPGDRDGKITFEDLIAGLTWRMIRAASLVADKTLYLGNWDLGVAITNARGMRSYDLTQVRWRTEAAPFAADEYQATTSAIYAELTGSRALVLERLVGRLNRALNNEQLPLKDFDALP